MPMKILNLSFYHRSTHQVARDLIGSLLVREHDGIIMAGIISETEAYGGANDPASHAYNKKTMRNAPMFGPVGHSYIYFIYGNHHCLNIVARDAESNAGAVLIRSIIPLQSIDYMQKLRAKNGIKNLTNGPGKLAQALGLDRSHNNIDMCRKGSLYITQSDFMGSIDCTRRIGISKGQDLLWRFVLNQK